MVEILPAVEIEYVVHAGLRSVLPARGLPPGVAEAAPAKFMAWRERLAFEDWVAGGCEVEWPQVDSAGYWLTREVEVCRDREAMAAWRRDMTARARRAKLFEPPPPAGEGEEAPDDRAALVAYGRRCLSAAADRGAPPPVKAPAGDVEVAEYARRVWGRWASLMRRAPSIADVVARSYCRRVPHAEFWRLVADMRPVVISATSGRLIDGLRRVEAHLAAGRRSPGVPVVRRAYESDHAEREAVVRLNASNPALSPLARVRLAEWMRPAYRAVAARNSGRPGGELIDLSGALPTKGRRGRRLKRKKGAAVRVDDRLADLAGMSRPTFVKYLARAPAAPMPPPAFWAASTVAADAVAVAADAVAAPPPPAV